MAKRSAKQRANDKRLGEMAKARHAHKAGGHPKKHAAAHKAKGHRGHRPSSATIRAMKAGAKARWARLKGTGKPGKGKHIPLTTLKHKVVRLNQLIKQREGKKEWA